MRGVSKSALKLDKYHTNKHKYHGRKQIKLAARFPSHLDSRVEGQNRGRPQRRRLR